jgi:DNA-binding GntR family transcriptional regulator
MRLKRVPVMPSRKDAVVNALRDSILSSDLPAGSRLNLDEIAHRIGVSRMPVREAVKQLEVEGLVTIYPHRGIEVSTLDAADIEEIFDIRIVLETRAVELAIPRLTAAELNGIEAILTRMDRPGITGKTWRELNQKFHHAINAASGSPRLVSLIEGLRVNVERYVGAYLAMRGYAHPQQQHRDLLAACRIRDIPRAKAIIREHFTDTSRMLVAALSGEQAPAKAEAQSPRTRTPEGSDTGA